mgnify:CR=1 FL=1
MENQKLYNAYLASKQWLDEYMNVDLEEVEGLGKYIQDVAKAQLALVVLDEKNDTEEIASAGSELIELIEQLEEHTDDYVRVVHSAMGGWELSDMMGEE